MKKRKKNENRFETKEKRRKKRKTKRKKNTLKAWDHLIICLLCNLEGGKRFSLTQFDGFLSRFLNPSPLSLEVSEQIENIRENGKIAHGRGFEPTTNLASTTTQSTKPQKPLPNYAKTSII